MSLTKAVEAITAQDAPRIGHMPGQWHRDADPVGKRQRSMHGGAQEPDHRNVDREPAAIDARIEGVRGDHGIIAVLRGPEDFAHDGGRLHHMVQAVEHALRPDRVVELRAFVVVRKTLSPPWCRATHRS